MRLTISRPVALRFVLITAVGCASTVSANTAGSPAHDCPLPDGTTCQRGTRCLTPFPSDWVCHVDGVLDCAPLPVDAGAAPTPDADVTQDVPIATPDAGVSCALPDGRRCAAGTTCPLGDGCNQCHCASDGVLGCTGLVCPEPDAGATCGALGSICRTGDECCSGWCPTRGSVVSTCEAPAVGSIACNDRLCDAATEYCELTYSDVPTPDSTDCHPRPVSCDGVATCGCVSHPCGPCEVRSSGVLVFRCPGG